MILDRTDVVSIKVRKVADGNVTYLKSAGNFTKYGKVWQSVGSFKLHMNLYLEYNYGAIQECVQGDVVIFYSDATSVIHPFRVMFEEYLLDRLSRLNPSSYDYGRITKLLNALHRQDLT